MTRYCDFLNSIRSTTIFCQGRCGISDGISGSGCALVVWQQTLQLSINSLISLFTSGHHTYSMARLLHLVIPWCPSCSFSSMPCRNAEGITTLVPYISRPLTMVNSA